MEPSYHIQDTSEILSPGLVIFKQLVERNLRTMLEMAGDPKRLRPHVKTHKMREIVRLALKHGITKHKCATIAEAEMLAQCEVPDVLLAYPMVGPNQQRLARLIARYPGTRFTVLVDHPANARSLSEAMASQSCEASVLLDLDTGQGRSGIPPGDAAAVLYRLADELPGLRPEGLHVYDGHNKQHALAEREAAICEQMVAVTALRARLEAAGLPVPRMVLGGTPTFPVYARLDDNGIECSPGTCVLHDDGYGTKFPDLPFVPAAILLTRVISVPGADRVCLDLGYKAIAADPPGDRLRILDLEDARFLLQNEEHLLVETSEAGRFQPGDELLAIPTHVCPTCALHKEAYVVEDGRVVDRWTVAARDRFLEI